jgi:LPXTG-motif cell wall-anchored protein
MTAVNSLINFSGQTGSISVAASVPATTRTGIAIMIGLLLLAGSGLLGLRGRQQRTAA